MFFSDQLRRDLHGDPDPDPPELELELDDPEAGTSNRPSDRYGTPPWLCEVIRRALGGRVDCDPFADPTSSVQAEHYIDVRRGGNGYRDSWPGRTAHVNAAYSGQMPQRTAAICAERFLAGWEIVNVCPAAVGSAYWRRDVWPFASAIAFLGRLAFPAGVDVHDSRGRLVCAAGKAANGNRTEIAAVYQGPHTLRFRRLLEPHGHVEVIG